MESEHGIAVRLLDMFMNRAGYFLSADAPRVGATRSDRDLVKNAVKRANRLKMNASGAMELMNLSYGLGKVVGKYEQKSGVQLD